MKYLGAKGNEKNTSYQVYGSVRVNNYTLFEKTKEGKEGYFQLVVWHWLLLFTTF